MTRRLVEFWVWFAVALPALIGLVLLLSPGNFFPQPIEVTDAARMVAIRNLVYSAVLLTAILTQSKKVVGILIFGRGLTDLADVISSMLASGRIESAGLIPLSFAIVSFYASYYLLHKAK